MITLSPKALAVAAITMGLSSSVMACLDTTAYVGNGNYFSDGAYGNITTVDNDVQTCSGSIGTGDQDIGDGCISGFSLNYDYSDNNGWGPLPITYCNPGNCYQLNIPCTEVENQNNGKELLYSCSLSQFC